MEDLTGRKNNLLTAIKPLFKYRREWVWLCKCDCGNKTNVRISKFKNGTTKSCGCVKNKNLHHNKQGRDSYYWKGYEDLSMSFFSRIKHTAEQRNIIFDVDMKYLYDLYVSQNGKCAYTGLEIFLPINVRQLRGENNEMIASLDRIDNEKGYVKGNLQWVCKRINYMKHTMKEEYFFFWVKKICEHKKL
jgi:hypothetical protein